MADNKQYVTQAQDNGRVMISEDVISSITTQALVDIEGYAGLSSNPAIDLADMIGKKSWGKGLKVSIGEKDDVTIECNVIMRYGHSVVAVATAIQEAIVNAISSMTGIQAIVVNVNVCGIVRQ